MSKIVIRHRDWSTTIQSDDPYFSTFLSSYKESTGETPKELRFDEWEWLPSQWSKWNILREILTKFIDGWSSELLNRTFGMVKYVDIEIIASAMLDLPSGWESFTIIDERIQSDMRRKLYESIGRMIMEKDPSWLTSTDICRSDLVKTGLGKIEHLLRLVYRIIGPTNANISCDTFAGIVWNAKMTQLIDNRDMWKMVMWNDVYTIYSNVFAEMLARSSTRGSNSWVHSVRYSVYTIRYLALRQITLIDGIHYPLTILIPYDSDNIDLDVYSLSLEAYMRTDGCTWRTIGIERIPGSDDSLTGDVHLECYAARVHAGLIREAVMLLNSMYNNRIDVNQPIERKYLRAIAIYLLLRLGRSIIKKILTMSCGHLIKDLVEDKETVAMVFFEVFTLYQDDECLSSDMNNKVNNVTTCLRQMVDMDYDKK